MNPPLYALTPVDQVENGYHILIDTEDIHGSGVYYIFEGLVYESKHDSEIDDGDTYDTEGCQILRPLPAGTVAVSEEELKKLIRETWEQADKSAMEHEAYPYGRRGGYKEPSLEQFTQSKLVQQGK